MSMNKFVVLFFTFFSLYSQAQQVGVGQWREHVPYRYTFDVCEGNNDIIFCATPFAVFSYNKSDNSVERYFKGEGLSDTDISNINFNKDLDLLVVGYANGNIDVISHGRLINISELKTSNILAEKRVNEIFFDQKRGYLSCGFGIVVVDLEKFEISDTYYLGQDASYVYVNDLERTNDFWYAATKSGVYRAATSSTFLSNSTAWEKMDNLPDNDSNYIDIDINSQHMYLLEDPFEDVSNRTILYKNIEDNTWTTWEGFENKYIRSIYLTEDYIATNEWSAFKLFRMDHSTIHSFWGFSDLKTQGNEVIQDESGWFWLANSSDGLGGTNFEDEKTITININSPRTVSSRKIDAYNNNIWVAAGGVSTSWVSSWNNDGVYGFVDETWYSSRDFYDEIFTDVLDVTINPTDNTEVYAGSWHQGLIRIKDKQVADVFNETNSTLEVTHYEAWDFTGVASVDFDKAGNLWFTGVLTNYPLHVRKADGTFKKFSFASKITDEDRVINVFAASNGYIWIFIRGNGILVFDYNGTIDDTSDDRYKLLKTEEGLGGLPSKYCFSITEDLDGEIWIGTQQGPAIFYSPESIFNEEDFDAQQILITQDGNAQLLLETEVINGIEIDGGNRKWIATQNSGVYLLSSDGTRQISHFTEKNSPLFSDNVTDLAINHDNGEVFFVTDRGIISYRGDATNFYEEMDNVNVFPNPVYPQYDGIITIDGLAQDADVKITDFAGNIVYHTVAEGGRATWNGKSFDGSRPVTGVYLIFVSTDNGKSTNVSKIAFVN